MIEPLALVLPSILRPMLFSGFLAHRFASGTRPRPLIQRNVLAGTLGPAVFTLVVLVIGVAREAPLPDPGIIMRAILAAQVLLLGLPSALFASHWFDRWHGETSP